MISNKTTDTKQRFLHAIRDIHEITVTQCPLTLVGFLANEGVQLTLKKWINSTDIPGDIRADFNAILHGLDKAIEAFPADPEQIWAHTMRGRALVALGYYKVSFEDFDYAIEHAPTSPIIGILIAEACLAQATVTMKDPMNYLAAAMCYLDCTIAADPTAPRPRVARAVCVARMMKICGYYKYTELFKARYRAILEDLDTARKHCCLGDSMKIDALEAQLFAMLTDQ